MTSSGQQRLAKFKKSQPRSPRLAPHRIRARGLEFAGFLSPQVAGRPPLLCVNDGLIHSHVVLWPALAPLAAGRQLVLYDQRGRGASQAPPAPRAARIEHDAGDIPALRDALGIACWDILGHSWGGGIAMLAAERDPTGVRRLVLVDAVGATSDWMPSLHPDAVARLTGDPRQQLAMLDPLALRAGDPGIHTEYCRALYPAYFADAELSRAFSPPRGESTTGAGVASHLRREGYDWRQTLQRIRSVALVVHGKQDVLPRRLAAEIASLIPRATVADIDGAGHMPFFEQPAEFFETVTAFLEQSDLGA